MSKDVQELVQKDAGTEDEEDIEPSPAIEILAKEELVLTKTPAVAQPTPEKAILT